MKSQFLTPLINEDIDYKYSKIFLSFQYYSAILGLVVDVPFGFIHDYESVPGIRGTSKRGGVIHDYLCRKDSVPKVTKKVAADVYDEAVKLSNKSLNGGEESFGMMCRRRMKYWTVRIAPNYFHKLSVFASYEEMSE